MAPVSGFFFFPLGSFNPAVSCWYLKRSLDGSPQAPPHPARPFTSPRFSVSTPPYPEHRVLSQRSGRCVGVKGGGGWAAGAGSEEERLF